MAQFTTVDAALEKAFRKPNGKEKEINECLHFGVGNTPYAYVSDLKKAGCKYTAGNNSLYGHVDKTNARKLLEYLQQQDGYLVIQ